MSVKPKDIALFLLGAVAGAAVLKYASMTEEEKEKLIQTMKDKAGDLKNQANAKVGDAKDYFSELKVKGSDYLKENWAEAEKYLQEVFKRKSKTEKTAEEVVAEVKDAVDNIRGEEGEVIPV